MFVHLLKIRLVWNVLLKVDHLNELLIVVFVLLNLLQKSRTLQVLGHHALLPHIYHRLIVPGLHQRTSLVVAAVSKSLGKWRCGLLFASLLKLGYRRTISSCSSSLNGCYLWRHWALLKHIRLILFHLQLFFNSASNQRNEKFVCLLIR